MNEGSGGNSSATSSIGLQQALIQANFTLVSSWRPWFRFVGEPCQSTCRKLTLTAPNYYIKYCKYKLDEENITNISYCMIKQNRQENRLKIPKTVPISAQQLAKLDHWAVCNTGNTCTPGKQGRSGRKGRLIVTHTPDWGIISQSLIFIGLKLACCISGV